MTVLDFSKDLYFHFRTLVNCWWCFETYQWFRSWSLNFNIFEGSSLDYLLMGDASFVKNSLDIESNLYWGEAKDWKSFNFGLCCLISGFGLISIGYIVYFVMVFLLDMWDNLLLYFPEFDNFIFGNLIGEINYGLSIITLLGLNILKISLLRGPTAIDWVNGFSLLT